MYNKTIIGWGSAWNKRLISVSVPSMFVSCIFGRRHFLKIYTEDVEYRFYEEQQFIVNFGTCKMNRILCEYKQSKNQNRFLEKWRSWKIWDFWLITYSLSMSSQSHTSRDKMSFSAGWNKMSYTNCHKIIIGFGWIFHSDP